MPIQDDVRISHVHNTALCREIGDRLAICLGGKPAEMPPHLVALVNLVRQLFNERADPNLPETFLASAAVGHKSSRVDGTGLSRQANTLAICPKKAQP